MVSLLIDSEMVNLMF